MIEDLPNFRPTSLPELPKAEMAIRYYDKAGKARVKGGKYLKSSQSYPVLFHPQLAHLRHHTKVLQEQTCLLVCVFVSLFCHVLSMCLVLGEPMVMIDLTSLQLKWDLVPCLGLGRPFLN